MPCMSFERPSPMSVRPQNIVTQIGAQNGELLFGIGISSSSSINNVYINIIIHINTKSDSKCKKGI